MLEYVRKKWHEFLELFLEEEKDIKEVESILDNNIELDDWYLDVGARAGFEKN